ncbi:MAG: NYN domain-containing protein [Oscillospiraceae bacterium]|jgi:predicted RNA-binding protein with PIN domain|nr:NYN domain-containing protein [Oscillospiraceae bacterium]
MNPLLVVDGYNIIGAWELAAQKSWSFEECRAQLLARLEEYAAYHDLEAVLVFDGTRSERLIRSEEQVGAVRVVYTRHGETADQYIERLCDGQPRHREVRVATSDAVEQTVILGRGASRLPARELLREMAQARAAQRAQIERPRLKSSPLIGRLPQEQQEALERMRRGGK